MKIDEVINHKDFELYSDICVYVHIHHGILIRRSQDCKEVVEYTTTFFLHNFVYF